MLSALGIIAEFNPFHNGHRYLIQRARRLTGADVTVVVMSGNWVQRGEPALLDKWHRTRTALDHGVDLIVELPAQFAVQSADRFARDSFRLIDQLHCRDLAFGCENSRLDFASLARVHVSHRYFSSKAGRSYADQFRQAFFRQTGVKVERPNDILGLNYFRARLALGSSVHMVPIQRCLESSRYVSATTIRKRYLNGQNVSSWVPSEYQDEWDEPVVTWQKLWPFLRLKLIETPLSSLQQIYQMREGLEFRLKRAAIKAVTFQQFLALIKTKRYTYSSLFRLCFYVLTQLTQDDWQRIRNRQYLRILGFDQAGQQYLHQIKKSVSIPIISKVDRETLKRALNFEFKAGIPIQMIDHHYQDLFQHPIVK